MLEILIFGYSKCQSCHNLKKELDKEGIKYKYLDVKKENTNDWFVNSVPTTIILKNGNVKEFLVGNGQKILRIIKEYWETRGNL